MFLPKNLAALAGVAAKEATRYSANALRVLDPGDGTYRVEVTTASASPSSAARARTSPARRQTRLPWG